MVLKSAQKRLDVVRRFHSPGGIGPSRIGLTRLAHLSVMDTANSPSGLEPVLTTSQLAAHLGVSPQAIHDLRHLGRGPRGFRVGRELRYRLSAIEAWLGALEAADSATAVEARS